MVAKRTDRAAATYADIEALPSNMVGEIIRGVLHVNRRPALRHSRASSALGMKIGSPFDLGDGGPGGWIILDEPELHFEADVLVPDLAGWRRERVPELPDAPFLTIAPDWVCEVLSPSTKKIDRAEKLPIYARERVEHVWLIEPGANTLEVFRLDGATYRLLATHYDDAKVRIEPFDAIELDLSVLWR